MDPLLPPAVLVLALLSGGVGGVQRREVRLLDGAADDPVVATTSRCYDFTWIGEQGPNDSGDNNCGNYFPQDLCSPPLVATTGPNAANGPDLDMVVEACRDSPSCNVTTDLYCTRAFDYVCIKYTKFQRGTGAATYYTSFCGKGIDKGWDGVAITSGCHRETNRDGYDIEVCFCTDELCNSATKQVHVGWWLAFILLLQLMQTYFSSS